MVLLPESNKTGTALTVLKVESVILGATQDQWGCAMEPISITVSAGGKPFLTTRVRSVSFENATPLRGADRVGQPARTDQVGAVAPEAPRSGAPVPTPSGNGVGFGAEAQRGLAASNFSTAPANATGAPAETPEAADGLTDAERDQVEKLKARDAEVKRHEQAHAAVGGQYASAPTYTFQLGPDGRRYAIGGEVKIDIAPVAGDPEATIDKMTVVKAAALAPAEPSSADRRVASLADAQRLEAVSELASLRSEERIERFEKANGEEAAVTPDANDKQGPPDTRLASAASILSRGEETLPGQKLDTAA